MVLPWPRCLLIYFCVDDRITAFLIELWCARCWAAVAIVSVKADLRHRAVAMLVLSRKVGQRILIGDDISITIVRVAQGGVRIGIDAPKELPVVREELKDKLDAADEAKKSDSDVGYASA